MTIKNNNNIFKKYVKRLWIYYFLFWLLLFLLFFTISIGGLGPIPSFEELENPRSNIASEVYSNDGVLLGKYYIENRSNIHFKNLPDNAIKALLATEDIRFYKHSGVDIKSLLRVIGKNIIAGHRSSGGGSTITQQLAKNLFPRKKNRTFIETVIIKFKEWVTAIKLERNYTKEEIIAMYLNTVDFGSQAFGIKSAAKTYFNKEVDSLKIEESAMLIGLLKAPTYYNPVRNPQNALKRRNVILNQMKRYKFITAEYYDSISQIPIDVSQYKIQDQNVGLATYFREYLRNVLIKWCENHKKSDGTSYNLYKDGLKIYTTIDSRMQKYAEEAVAEHLGKELQNEFYKHWKGFKKAPFDNRLSDDDIQKLLYMSMQRSERYYNLKRQGLPENKIKEIFNTPTPMTVFSWKKEIDTIMSPMDSIKYYKWFLLAGFMAMEPQTGYVKAYVGGINYKYFKYDHVVLAKRQVGSTFKPFVYTIAMQEKEFSPCSKIPNVQVSFDLPNGTKWEPKNSSKYKNGEMVTLKEALANSINWISAFLIKRYSPAAVIKIAKKMGITSHIPEVYSICLGTPEISLYEMVGAMNTYANKGVYIKPMFITKIEDKNGNIIETFVPETHEAMSEETAYLMIELMKGVVESGTGARLRSKYGLTNPIAGKTGTTDNNSDGWFMGITPNLVSGVWVGCEDRSVHFRSTALGQGANMALPIWALFMKKVYADGKLGVKTTDDFEKPKKPLSVEIDCNKYNASSSKTIILENEM
ncbi:MAG TPA: PBP1A family penicillin-binding protein [Bacteroidales bacterium]|nr:PBP1A family penicillin-binding protein [Bacteroidales bacterium]